MGLRRAEEVEVEEGNRGEGGWGGGKGEAEGWVWCSQALNSMVRPTPSTRSEGGGGVGRAGEEGERWGGEEEGGGRLRGGYCVPTNMNHPHSFTLV